MSDYSVYIHLPFCKTRCSYCDFFSTATDTIPFDDYRRALIAEWKRRRAAAPHLNRIVSLYIGGGTPSLWSAEQLTALLHVFSILGDEEVTVEVNPKDADLSWFCCLEQSGVNRFSIGVQALSDERLRFLGRRHTAKDAMHAVHAALSAGARSVSADLIFGTFGHKPDQWRQELKELIALGVHHVSAYELTVSEGTPMAARRESGERVAEPEKTAARLYRTARCVLSTAGFQQYEVSNYASVSHRSRHNAHYWTGGEYIGIGAGAHGFIAPSGRFIRYANSRDVEDYIRSATSCDAPLEENVGAGGFTENLSIVDHAKERMMLGLRTSDGAPFDDILHFLPEALQEEWRRLATMLQEQKLVRFYRGCIVPTAAGLIRADGIAEVFF